MTTRRESWVIIRTNPHDDAAVGILGRITVAPPDALASGQILVRYHRCGRAFLLPFAADHLLPATRESVHMVAKELDARAGLLRRWLKSHLSRRP